MVIEDPHLKRTFEVLSDAVVCMANADGGEIILGVTDLPGRHGSLQGIRSGITADLVVRARGWSKRALQ